jgi:hypothetical protein
MAAGRTLMARIAIGAALAVLMLLGCLHLLSPEFNPSFRVLSEYARGQYRWVLSVLFVCWAISSWTLAIAIWPHANGALGRIGLGFLIAAGEGDGIGIPHRSSFAHFGRSDRCA